METREEKNKKIQQEIIREERTKRAKHIIKIVSSILITIFLILGYGIFIGAKYVMVNEHKVVSHTLPNRFNGLKVVQISDLLYNSFNKKDLDNLKNKVNELNPDIIVFTGNMIKKNYILTKEDIKILEDFFLNLNAKIKKFATIGEFDDDSFYLIMETSNFTVLSNSEELLYNKDIEPIRIIGIDTNKINLTLKDNPYYSICLLSNPDKIKEIKKNVNCNLAISGSTLGGEIRIPFTEEGIFDNHEYYKSYYKIDNTKLFVSNGIGNNLNIRLFNRPSLNFFRINKY